MKRLALIVLFALPAISASAAPTVQQLLAAERQANASCRGSDPNDFQTQSECSRRDRLYGRLQQEGWCYGKSGQVGADMKWHRCGAGSIVSDDLSPSP